ncbi:MULTISPECIES: response regulator [Meridianimarinicoccus]|uniref:Response regulator n=1 Tax=Meridianimarinicoccus marinus TaxID=3231483 RepID=A0ABV3LAG0_9RHOB|nr:response regulator [Fluviibacterium sp. MJW13]
MTVLIVESNPHLAGVWSRHIERCGRRVMVAHSQEQAINVLQRTPVSIILLNVMLDEGSAIAVADYTSYRFPKVKVLFVTAANFFSDGSIFNHVANACAFMPVSTPPDDLAAMVEHYAARD